MGVIHIRKKLNRGVGLFIVLFLISGCSKGSIAFVDAESMNYETSFNLCSLVSEIDGQGVNSLLINDNAIHLDGKTVTCNTTDVTVVANEPLEISYLYKGTTYLKKITFVEETKKEDEHKKAEETPQEEFDEDDNVLSEPEEPEETKSEEVKETTKPIIKDQPKEQSKPKVPSKSKPETKPSQNGAYKEFLSSQTVTHEQAKANCVAYASQYTNFTGCRKILDKKTNLIIGFEPY